MTIQQATKHLIESKEFKEIAKGKNSIGGKYRMFLTRYNKGKIKTGAAIGFLLAHEYKVDIKKPK